MLNRHERLLLNKYRTLRNGLRKLSGRSGHQREVALGVLNRLYKERPDLQEVYPEAGQGDLVRLINWAAGASSKSWEDSSYPELKPYSNWFRDAQTAGTEAPIPWATILATSQRSANPTHTTFDVMKAEESSDISNHLVTLSLLVQEFALKNIVELGTRDGNSTLALLEAARNIGGHVTSVDIDACVVARERVAKARLNECWTFLQADDMQLSPPQIPECIDLLFVDTNHLYATTLAELNKYTQYLKKGGWIALHDYVSFAGVNRAVHDFIKSCSSPTRFYPFVHQNGLALLRLT